MRIELIRENEDGSADFSLLDMTADEITAFVRLGIVKALEEAIEDAKKYDPTLAPEPVKKKEWVGLTSEDIRQLEKENTVGGYNGDYCPTWDLIQAVEAFLREKNT